MKKMKLSEAKRILTLVANDPDHGTQGAYENQDVASQIILAELRRLEQENKRLVRERDQQKKEEFMS